MTSFNDREQGYENKFAHDEDLAFRIKARSHKLLGLWAAGKLGKSGAQAEAYARDLVMADFDHTGGGDIVARLMKDFAAANIKVTEKDIRIQMQECHAEAQKQLAGEA